MNIILMYFSHKYKGDWDKIYEALENKEPVSVEQLREFEKKIEENKWKVITILDTNYPQELKEVYKPPFVLWCKGDVELLEKQKICLTGNQMSDHIKKKILEMVPEFLKNYSLVTPSFKGVDEEIATLSIKNSKIFVLANGFDEPYLNSDITDRDLLISEFPPHANVSKNRLRMRNRIIAAMSRSLVLFSSKKNAGMENMVNNFLEQGKEIYCLPGDGGPLDGNTSFIKQGANILSSVSDVSL